MKSNSFSIVNNKGLIKLIIQFVKFGIVGISNTLIYLAIYYALVYFNVHYIISNAVGFTVSVLNAYYWNSKFVFSKSIENHGKTFLKTFFSYGSVFLLSTLLLLLMVSYLCISYLIAPIINLAVTVPLNFLMIKFWALK